MRLPAALPSLDSPLELLLFALEIIELSLAFALFVFGLLASGCLCLSRTSFTERAKPVLPIGTGALVLGCFNAFFRVIRRPRLFATEGRRRAAATGLPKPDQPKHEELPHSPRIHA